MIRINTSSFIPFYEQIKQHLKRQILRGAIKPRDPLPSIRELAASFLINPNTVARAYRELEMEGLITTQKGKGCYVAEGAEARIQEGRPSALNGLFDEAIEEARRMGYTSQEIKDIVDQRLAPRSRNPKGQG